MKFFKIIFGILFLFVASLASGATYEVSITEKGFDPRWFNIQQGDIVRWINKGTGLHSVSHQPLYGGPSYFDSGALATGSVFEYAVKSPGLYYFWDKLSPDADTNVGSFFYEGLTISPSDTVMDGESGFDLMIISNLPVSTLDEPYAYLIYFDDNLIFRGTELELSALPNVRFRFFSTNSFGTIIPVPAGVMPPGTHTVGFKVLTNSGKQVASDKVTYTVLQATAAPLLLCCGPQ